MNSQHKKDLKKIEKHLRKNEEAIIEEVTLTDDKEKSVKVIFDKLEDLTEQMSRSLKEDDDGETRYYEMLHEHAEKLYDEYRS